MAQLAVAYARRKRYDARLLVAELAKMMGGGAAGGAKKSSAGGLLRKMGTRIKTGDGGPGTGNE